MVVVVMEDCYPGATAKDMFQQGWDHSKCRTQYKDEYPGYISFRGNQVQRGTVNRCASAVDLKESNDENYFKTVTHNDFVDLNVGNIPLQRDFPVRTGSKVELGTQPMDYNTTSNLTHGNIVVGGRCNKRNQWARHASTIGIGKLTDNIQWKLGNQQNLGDTQIEGAADEQYTWEDEPDIHRPMFRKLQAAAQSTVNLSHPDGEDPKKKQISVEHETYNKKPVKFKKSTKEKDAQKKYRSLWECKDGSKGIKPKTTSQELIQWQQVNRRPKRNDFQPTKGTVSLSIPQEVDDPPKQQWCAHFDSPKIIAIGKGEQSKSQVDLGHSGEEGGGYHSRFSTTYGRQFKNNAENQKKTGNQQKQQQSSLSMSAGFEHRRTKSTLPLKMDYLTGPAPRSTEYEDRYCK